MYRTSANCKVHSVLHVAPKNRVYCVHFAEAIYILKNKKYFFLFVFYTCQMIKLFIYLIFLVYNQRKIWTLFFVLSDFEKLNIGTLWYTWLSNRKCTNTLYLCKQNVFVHSVLDFHCKPWSQYIIGLSLITMGFVNTIFHFENTTSYPNHKYKPKPAGSNLIGQFFNQSDLRRSFLSYNHCIS